MLPRYQATSTSPGQEPTQTAWSTDFLEISVGSPALEPPQMLLEAAVVCCCYWRSHQEQETKKAFFSLSSFSLLPVSPIERTQREAS